MILTRDEIQVKVNGIYARYPRLRDFTPECDCGAVWCGNYELTAEEKEAWDDLDAWLWLLGDP